MRIVILLAVLIAGGGSFRTLLAQSKPAELDSVLTRVHNQNMFSGVVLISEDERVVFSRSYGMAPDSTPLTIQTPLPLASITKTFTAAGVMLLQADGRLSYDDPVTKYLPELPYTGVTIRHLLNHTSGVHFLSLINSEWDTTRVLRNRDVLALLASHALRPTSEPGTRWTYSNEGYVLLASVIERVSGESYGDFLQERIFEPLGMQSARVDEAASGSRWLRWVGGDGVVASAADLLTWDHALRSGRLFNAQQLAQAYTRPRLPGGALGETGFGWMVADDPGGRVFHAGEHPEVKSGIQRYLDAGRTFILLQTEHGPYFYKVFGTVTKIWNGEPYEIPTRRTVAEVDPAIYERYAGVYDTPFGRIHITTEGGRLYLEPEGAGGKEELLPSSPTTFFFGHQDMNWEFFLDGDGSIKGFGFQGKPETMGPKIR